MPPKKKTSEKGAPVRRDADGLQVGGGLPHGFWLLNADGQIECECGKTFGTIDEWSEHTGKS